MWLILIMSAGLAKVSRTFSQSQSGRIALRKWTLTDIALSLQTKRAGNMSLFPFDFPFISGPLAAICRQWLCPTMIDVYALVLRCYTDDVFFFGRLIDYRFLSIFNSWFSFPIFDSQRQLKHFQVESAVSLLLSSSHHPYAPPPLCGRIICILPNIASIYLNRSNPTGQSCLPIK